MTRVELDQIINCHEACTEDCQETPLCCHATIAHLQAHRVYAVMIGEAGCMDSGIASIHHTAEGAAEEAARINAELANYLGQVSRWDRAHVEPMEIRP